ncbi:MAG: DUF6531 domain-containing protein [Dehalococcoidia bacterium]
MDPAGLGPPTREEELGSGSATPPKQSCKQSDPVNCATGNKVESQTDLRVGGRGPGLAVVRTYNSQLAASGGSGPFGYGWTGSYGAHLEVNAETGEATVHSGDGAAIRFRREGTSWDPVVALVQTKLREEGSDWAYILPDQTVLHFTSAGQLASEVDRNGNAVTFAYGGSGRLESATDAAGRKLTFVYNFEGLVETVKDPMGHEVKYGYESGNLTSVTLPGDTASSYRFAYNSSHEMTKATDGRGNAVETEYDGQQRVISQTDALGRKDAFEYTGTFGQETTITTVKAQTGAVTQEQFNIFGEPTAVTRAYGTSEAAETMLGYDEAGQLVRRTTPDGNTTTYTYNSAGDRTSETDPLGDKTEWSYDTTHDITATTTPRGETTTIKRDSHGNPEVIERPAPKGDTQITRYKYDAQGEPESVEDPLKRITKYEYDVKGNRVAEVDPEGDKRTWSYDEDSNVVATVSPRGHVTGAKEVSYTTKIERDARERAVAVTDPLKHITKYAYDAAGNLEKVTDPNEHTTTYTYDAANENTKVTEPTGLTTETEYDGAGDVIATIDGAKHVTKYKRNTLEETVEVVDPRGRTTTQEYNGDGSLVKRGDPLKRTTTYSYDAAGRLIGAAFSDGKTHAISYAYDGDGNRTELVDATGTTTYEYDQLDRLAATKDGHGDTVGYEYDLGNETTKIVYPTGKTVTQSFDGAGRLKSVTDWLEHTTTFKYNADSEPAATSFPSATSNEDTYGYDAAGRMSSVEMKNSSELLASLTYKRDDDGQITLTTRAGLPGDEKIADKYDANNRLTKAGTGKYEYDNANNITLNGSTSNTYSPASELQKAGTQSYSFDEAGERTLLSPLISPNTEYGYDQAGNLTSVDHPKEGTTPAIEDSYAYNGDGLRASQTSGGTASYVTWNEALSLPLVLSDGSLSYVYGPGGVPFEQINNSAGTVTYLHHDQPGSTRLLTSSTGTVTGKCTYGAYGTSTCEGASTTPLGYDGQLTSSDTGLIYLRARTYDPSTAQFLSVDPLEKLTRAPYDYAEDNPLNFGDPTGEGIFGAIGGLLFPGGGSGQACVGGTVSIGAVTLGGEVCYVHTPHGEGVAVTPSVTVGPGIGANIHAGAGESNACRPSEYGGLFSQASGSASVGFTGGYYNRFSSRPFSDVTGGRNVEGWTAGGAVGLNAEAGVGGSYTFTIPLGSEGGGSESSGCGCS